MNSVAEEAETVALKNVERLIEETGLEGVTIVRHADEDDVTDWFHCFVLKRRDPRHEDHSKMEVLLTCRVDMPGVEFVGNHVDGRLTKLYVDNGGWLWQLAVVFVREALEPKEEE